MEEPIEALEQQRNDLLKLIELNCELPEEEAKRYAADLEHRILGFHEQTPDVKKQISLGLKRIILNATTHEEIIQLTDGYEKAFTDYIASHDFHELFDFGIPFQEQQHYTMDVSILRSGLLFAINLGRIVNHRKDVHYAKAAINELDHLRGIAYNTYVIDLEAKKVIEEGGDIGSISRLVNDYLTIADNLIERESPPLKINSIRGKIKEAAISLYYHCLNLYYNTASMLKEGEIPIEIRTRIVRAYIMYQGLTFASGIDPNNVLLPELREFYNRMERDRGQNNS